MVVNNEVGPGRGWSYFVTMVVEGGEGLVAMEIHLPSHISLHNSSFSVGHLWILVDFKNSQILYAAYDSGKCNTFPLFPASQTWLLLISLNPWLTLFGIEMKEHKVASPHDIETFFSLNGGSKPPEKESFNGIESNKWTVSFNASDVDLLKNGVTNISFFWSRNESGGVEWESGWEWREEFPLGISVHAPLDPLNNKVQSTHFVFAYVTPNIMRRHLLQVPPHTYCERVQSTVMPSWSPFYSFRAEVVVSDNNSIISSNRQDGFIFYSSEYYDTIRGISSAVYQHAILDDPGSATEEVYEIHDHNLNEGFQWTVGGNCQIRPMILDILQVEDAWDLARLHLTDPKNFFDTTRPYTPVGERSVRGIPVQVLSEERRDWPTANFSDANVTSIWEWSITKKEWRAEEVVDVETNIPVQLDLTLSVEVKGENNTKIFHHGTIAYNLFNFHTEQRQFSHTFQIQHCANANNISNTSYALDLDPSCAENFLSTSRSNGTWLWNQIHELLFQKGKLETLLRISVVSMEAETPRAYFVLYDLWDYSDRVPRQPSVLAEGNWSQAIADKAFTLSLLDQNLPDFYHCTVKSIYRSPLPHPDGGNVLHSTGKYSSGAMGGLAIGMLLVGMVLSAGIVFAVYKWRNWSSGDDTIRFTNSHD